MGQLIYEFGGQVYIKMRIDVAANYQGHKDLKKLADKIEKYEGVKYSIRYKPSLFFKSILTMKFLIPAYRVVEFSCTNLDDK